MELGLRDKDGIRNEKRRRVQKRSCAWIVGYPETGPLPFFGARDQSPRDRVTVQILELFDPFLFRVNIEVVVTRQPEWPLIGLLGDGGFQGLNGSIQQPSAWLGNQHMHVFRHNHIAENMEDIPSAHLLQRVLEQLTGCSRGKIGQPIVTTEGEEVSVPSLLKACESGWHDKWSVIPP